MATKLEERIAKSKEYTAKLERMRREALRKERERQKKKDQRRNYLIGALVVDYFPDLREIEPGAKSDDSNNFALLESILLVLSSDKHLLESLMAKARCIAPSDFKG